MKYLIIVTFITLSFGIASNALYSKKDGVIDLNGKNFDDIVFSTDHAWIVEFFAPWCGHCKNLAPVYKKVATNIEGLVKVGAVNCDEDSNKGLCGKYGVQGFPTIKGFHGKRKPAKANKKVMMKIPSDYNGPRSAKSLVDFGLSLIPDFVTKLTEKKLETFYDKDNSTHAKIILFSEKSIPTSMIKSIAVDLKDRVHVAQVKSTEKTIVDQFGVEKFPSLVVLTPEGKVVHYEGKLKKDALLEFLKQYAKKDSSKDSSSTSQDNFDPTPTELKTMKEFKSSCVSPTGANMGLCMFALLQTSSDSYKTDYNVFKELKKSLGHSKVEGAKINFFVINVPAEPESDSLAQVITKELDIPTGQDPFVVAIHPRKEAFMKFLGAYEGYDENKKTGLDLQEFVGHVRALRGRWFKLPANLLGGHDEL